MVQMERDSETRLDWVAVDHWDTDNPRTHIVLRGRGRRGLGRSAREPGLWGNGSAVCNTNWRTQASLICSKAGDELEPSIYDRRHAKYPKAYTRAVNIRLGCELVRYFCEDIAVKGAWAGPTAIELFHYSLAPVAVLPIPRVDFWRPHILSDMTLGLGTAVNNCLAK
jgi:hypothetical protein